MKGNASVPILLASARSDGGNPAEEELTDSDCHRDGRRH